MSSMDERLTVIESKVDQILEILLGPQQSIEYSNFLLSLPDHLRLTVETLIGLRIPSSAEEVSAITKRARAVESGYLNQLVREGSVIGFRSGRTKLFKLNSKVVKI